MLPVLSVKLALIAAIAQKVVEAGNSHICRLTNDNIVEVGFEVHLQHSRSFNIDS